MGDQSRWVAIQSHGHPWLAGFGVASFEEASRFQKSWQAAETRNSLPKCAVPGHGDPIGSVLERQSPGIGWTSPEKNPWFIGSSSFFHIFPIIQMSFYGYSMVFPFSEKPCFWWRMARHPLKKTIPTGDPFGNRHLLGEATSKWSCWFVYKQHINTSVQQESDVWI